MRGTLIMVTAAAGLIALASQFDARAAQPPRVVGADCGWLAAQIGHANLWQTTFSGWRDDIFGKREEIFVAPCFASEAECKAWLYWAQTDWPHNFLQNPPCRKGVY